MAVWLAVWELASLYIGQEILLVSPVSVLRRLTVLAVQSDFWGSIAFSFFRIIGGFLLASLCGTLLASLSAAFRFVRDLLAPAMAAIKAVPVASFIILVLIWVPSRNLSVVISFLMVLPVIYTNVLGGILSTDRKLLEMAQVSVFRCSAASATSISPSSFPICGPAFPSLWDYAGKPALPPRSSASPKAPSEKSYTKPKYTWKPQTFFPGRWSSY